MTEFLDVDGCRLAYEDVGEGVPVVLSHGAGADRHMFDRQVEFLIANGYRAITWDLRLHGESRPSTTPLSPGRLVDDLVALVAHTGAERPVLVGQSLGGNLSQAVVRAHPELVRGLVVIDSAWNTGPLTLIEKALLGLTAPTLRLVPAKRLAPMMADASASTRAGRDYAHRVFSAMPKSDFVEVWRTAVGFLRPDDAYRAPVPLLLMRGADDRTGTIAAWTPRWAAAEGVSEVVIANAGHIANVDAPDAVNAALLTWLHAESTGLFT